MCDMTRGKPLKFMTFEALHVTIIVNFNIKANYMFMCMHVITKAFLKNVKLNKNSLEHSLMTHDITE